MQTLHLPRDPSEETRMELESSPVSALLRVRDGFSGQQMWVVPKPWLRECAVQPLLQSLLPTDAGWFPCARHHFRERPQGAEEHILIFCTAGNGSCQIDGVSWRIGPGNALLIPRGAPHAYWADSDTPWSIHWVHFTGITGDLMLSELGRDQRVLQVDTQSALLVEALFQECYRAFAGGFVIHRMIYSAQVLHHLLGKIIYGNSYYSPLQHTSRRRALEPTLTFLHQNSARKLTLKEIADHAGVSVSHLSALFKEQTGLSPMDYLIRYRMQRACVLLSVKSATVHEVAYEVGYSDPYYFSRLFKKVIGIAPLHYREHRGKRTNAAPPEESITDFTGAPLH